MKVFLLLLLVISTDTLFSMQNPYEVAKALNTRKYLLKEKFRKEKIKSNFHPYQNFSAKENSKPPRKNNNKKSQDQYTSIKAALGKEFFNQKNVPLAITNKN